MTGDASKFGLPSASACWKMDSELSPLILYRPMTRRFRPTPSLPIFNRDIAEAAFAEIAKRHPVSVLLNNVEIVQPALFDDIAVGDFDCILHLKTRTCLIAGLHAPARHWSDRHEHQSCTLG